MKNETINRLSTLSAKQLTAVAALVNGSTHNEAAQLAGVSRETVSRWCSKHPAFRVALNDSYIAVFTEHSIALSELRTTAINITKTALEELLTAIEAKQIDPVAAIRALTPFLSLPERPTPISPSTLAVGLQSTNEQAIDRLSFSPDESAVIEAVIKETGHDDDR